MRIPHNFKIVETTTFSRLLNSGLKLKGTCHTYVCLGQGFIGLQNGRAGQSEMGSRSIVKAAREAVRINVVFVRDA